MLLTVSTVMDELSNVRRFVAGNLAGGVDHMVVVLDAPTAEGQTEVAAWLEGRPQVTCIPAGEDWWAGDRPEPLNERQRINANVLRHVLTRFAWAEWLFHIDSDEIVQVDRPLLDTVSAETTAVRLAPLEAVSQMHWDGDPRLFKTLLGDDDLALLHALGVVARPHNDAYFHGHVDGKVGVRPGSMAWLRLHQVVDDDGRPVATFGHESLRLFHYESYSRDDFVRKWSAMTASGPSPRFRPERRGTAAAVRALIGRGLDDERAAAYLSRVFERTIVDDMETLRDLGMLVEADPGSGGHIPPELPRGARSALLGALDELGGESKRRFDAPESPGSRPAAGARKRSQPRRRGARRARKRWRRA